MVCELFYRLRQLGRHDIAVGGTFGAGHHFADLGLISNPRLDLTIHCPGRSADTSFIERLDPALKHTEDRSEPARLALHVLRRTESFFEGVSTEEVRADPIECFLDLHEARLEAQAQEFLEHLIEGRREGWAIETLERRG